MNLVPFQPHHIDLLVLSEAQLAALQPKKADLALGDAWSCFVGEYPVACGGLVEVWEGRGYCWAIIGMDAAPHIRAVIRAIQAKFRAVPMRRLEMAVECTGGRAKRFAEALGFQNEGLMRAYLPGGRDAFMYARVSNG